MRVSFTADEVDAGAVATINVHDPRKDERPPSRRNSLRASGDLSLMILVLPIGADTQSFSEKVPVRKLSLTRPIQKPVNAQHIPFFDTVGGKRRLFEVLLFNLGMIPNVTGAVLQSPAMLDGYISIGGAQIREHRGGETRPGRGRRFPGGYGGRIR